MKNLFSSYRLSIPDYLIGGSFLVLCYFSFFHGDMWGAGWDSLNYLFGNPLEFYENCKKIKGGGENMLGTPYPPTIYVIFAAWLYPFKLFGLLTDPNHFPLYLTYWLKVLTTLVYAASGLIFYKITQHYFRNRDWGRYGTAIWLTTPLAVFSQFIFSQYDIFYVFLTLAGFLMFLRGNISTASLLFGIAITFKYFPTFVFIPLLLFFEKRIFKILVSLFIFLIPTLLIQYLYGQSPAFIEGVKNHNAIDRVFAASIDIGGGWKIYYLFALFTILAGITYLLEASKEKMFYTAAYIFLVASILPFLFILWHPQWVMFFAPAIVLTTIIDKRCDRFLLLDLFGMLCFIATVSIAFQNNVDAAMFRGGLLGLNFNNSYKMAKFFNLFREHSSYVFLSSFWGYLVIQLVLKYRPVINLGLGQENRFFDYRNVRYRFYVGLLIFIFPACLAIYKDFTNKHLSIVNEGAGKHYGELLKDRTFEQSFVAKGRFIKKVDLLLATFARQNSGSVFLEIIDSNNQFLAKAEQPIESINDNSWQTFNFDSINVVKDMPYRLRLTSPTGQTGNAITWWSTPNDSYLKGNAIIDGVSQGTDFAFKIKFVK